MHPSPIRSHLSLTIFVFFLAALTLAACELRLQIPPTSDAPDMPKYEFEATGEDYLVSALDEVHAIADWAETFTNGPNRSISNDASVEQRSTLAKTAIDTAYIYGQIIAGGYGAVVTERYAYPKGLLLITIRKTYGKENGHVVTETKRYASHTDFRNDNPQQTNVTELFGLQRDTIVTYVLRNGRLETYTFRLPVITRVVNPQDGSIRVTTRYASGGAVVSKVQDGDGNLVQLRKSFGEANGSVVTRTEFPDRSWRQVRTLGQADGTILANPSGFSSLGSGCATPAPRPPILKCMPQRTQDEAARAMTEEGASLAPTFASGCATIRPPMPPPPPKRSVIPQQVQAKPHTIGFPGEGSTSMSLASGMPCPRPPMPPPPPKRTVFPRQAQAKPRTIDFPAERSTYMFLASGIPCPCPPKTIPPPRVPTTHLYEPSKGDGIGLSDRGLAFNLLASGGATKPQPPPPPTPQRRMLSEATCETMPEKEPVSRSLASGCPLRPPKPPLFPPAHQRVMGEATCGTTSEKQQLYRSFASGGKSINFPISRLHLSSCLVRPPKMQPLRKSYSLVLSHLVAQQANSPKYRLLHRRYV